MRIALALLVGIVFSQSLEAAENELESWYTYWGIGYSDNSLFDDFGPLETDVSHVAIATDTFGFYWPIGQKTLVGGIINGASDFYEADLLLVRVEFNSYNFLYSISAMHFLKHEIGRGFFVRADAGLAVHHFEVKMDIDSDFEDWLEAEVEEVEWTSETGSGFLIGGGYGIPITSGTRMLINAYISQRYVEGESMSIIGITLNGLF